MGKQTQQTAKQTIIHNLQPKQGWRPPLKTNTMLRVCYESKIITNVKLCIRDLGRRKEKRERESTRFSPKFMKTPFLLLLSDLNSYCKKLSLVIL